MRGVTIYVMQAYHASLQPRMLHGPTTTIVSVHICTDCMSTHEYTLMKIKIDRAVHIEELVQMAVPRFAAVVSSGHCQCFASSASIEGAVG